MAVRTSAVNMLLLELNSCTHHGAIERERRDSRVYARAIKLTELPTGPDGRRGREGLCETRRLPEGARHSGSCRSTAPPGESISCRYMGREAAQLVNRLGKVAAAAKGGRKVCKRVNP